MERAIMEINDLEPAIVVCSGDLTAYGFKQEYAEAKGYLERLKCEALVVVPGNHDSRNVGYIHFEELFGERNPVVHLNGVSVVAIDSTEPDLDHGHIGRSRYSWIKEQFSQEADFRIFVLHHHLLPVPGTGRERNVVYDAGDALEALQSARVNLVLSGHKHVPYAWRLENIFIVNAGTVSSLRLRGNGRPSDSEAMGDPATTCSRSKDAMWTSGVSTRTTTRNASFSSRRTRSSSRSTRRVSRTR
jgi:3',5'-cyclic-AMP phosphodiesterase